ncbi:MAG: ABC transporter ATP-binding protein [Lachnospiraceae bacterium]|nr:ABC transporter ATP-binding protein [Lachnospiraceae bacterium]MBR3165417.1 ABC transporter ATP-binding protein [Lachnospiraceae bacterium]
MLKATDLILGYDGVPVIFGVSLEVHEKEVVSVVGSNGAGKSTILRGLSGLIKPMAGKIEFMGEDITRTPAHKLVPMGISHVPEGRQLFGKLSVQENLMMGAYTLKNEADKKDALESVYALFPRLKERADQAAETFSGGEQQMLAIARGLMSKPKLLMIDEMSLGLAPVLVDKVMDSLKEIRATGITVLIVEQKVKEALELADRGYVLATGRILQSGTSAELLESDIVKKAYLGM